MRGSEGIWVDESAMFALAAREAEAPTVHAQHPKVSAFGMYVLKFPKPMPFVYGSF